MDPLQPNYVSEESYQREHIPNAKQLSKSYTFEVLPNNYKNKKFQLIEKIDKWSVYSDKYGIYCGNTIFQEEYGKNVLIVCELL